MDHPHEGWVTKIKEGMGNNVLLGIANPHKQYVLLVDASAYAVGAVLSQLEGDGNERPCAFFSEKLSGKQGMGQRGCSVREQETYCARLAKISILDCIQSDLNFMQERPQKPRALVQRRPSHCIRSSGSQGSVA